jgi:hypothetical protein
MVRLNGAAARRAAGAVLPAFLCLAMPTPQAAFAQDAAPPRTQRSLAKAKPADPESRTNAALSAMFSGDRRRLAELYQESLAEEQQEGNEMPLRQSDSILYLYNSSQRDRERFLLGMELAATEARSEELRTRILLSLLDDEYYELNQLSVQNRFNKFTRVFNRASASLSKLALFQPQDAAQLLLDGAYSLRKARDTTERERMIVYLADAFLKKYPDAPESPEVREFREQLRGGMRVDWAKREELAGGLALARGNYDAAEFHLENAVLLNPDDGDTSAMLSRTRTQWGAAERAAVASISVSRAESGLDRDSNTALAKALRAVLLDRKEDLEQLAAQAAGIADSVQYALAGIEERHGAHDAALARLASLAQSAPDSPGGRAAAASLDNPAFNLDQRYGEAVAEMKERQRKFVLTGNRSAEDGAYAAGSAAIQGVGQGAAGVGALFLTDVLVRGVAERFRTHIEVDEVIDAGALYIRRYPKSARSQEIAAQMADLTRKSGMYERSGEYLELAGADTPEKKAKLRENQARKMLDDALRDDDLAARKTALERIATEYGDTKVSAKAARELAKLQPTITERSVVLSRKALERDPDFVQSLGIDPSLVDGNRRNGEMSDEGLAIDIVGRRFSYKLRGGSDFMEGRVPKEGADEILAHAVAIFKSDQFRQTGKDALFRQKVPIAVQGGAGGSGVEIAPKIIPFKTSEKDAKYFE